MTFCWPYRCLPSHVYAKRDVPGKTCLVEDFDEWILVDGKEIMKPLVEKRVDATDHYVALLLLRLNSRLISVEIRIYYPMSSGGGIKRLFRKVNHENEVRKEGSYL
jgi:hypothetical protein